jgi:hypothetical protein
VEIQGGLPPYTYAADKNGQILTSGEPFAVIVMDGMGCEAQVFGTAVPCASNMCTISTAIQVEHPSCKGYSNGSILATVTGNNSSVAYQWSNGAQTALNSNLVAGTYTLTVTENTGCLEIASATVTEPPGLSLTPTKTDVSCHSASNGSIDLEVTGGGPSGLTFLWSNGQTSEDLANLPPGTYTVTVTEPAGCTSTSSTSISQPAPLQLAATPVAVSCPGEADGMLSVYVSGGTAGHMYLWSNGQTTQHLDNLAPGTYTVTVTDAHNCTASLTSQITEPPALDPVGSTISPASCFDSADGSIQLALSGGVPGYSYLWSTGSSNQDQTGLPGGSYTVTITQANSCTVVFSAVVPNPDSIFVRTDSVQQPVQGLSNGMIAVNTTGGTAPYTFAWYQNDSLYISDQEDLDSLSGGQYTLVVVDSSGCEAELVVTLTETVSTNNGPDAAFQVWVYPNPAHDHLTVSVKMAVPQTLQLRFVDPLGRLLQHRSVENVRQQEFFLELQDLPAGMYFLQVMADQEQLTRSIIIGR